MSEIRILGVLVPEKGQASLAVQATLTKYGCSIKTRLGLNNLDKPGCENCGLIILELSGDPNECISLENELWALQGVRVQKMVF